jgi:U3 small nucleolar RNA-associated protein 7
MGGSKSRSKGRAASSDAEQEEDRPLMKKPKIDSDPNGSLQVARGLSSKEAKEKRHDLQQRAQKQQETVEKFLNAGKTKERRAHLALDDRNPNLEALNDKQKLALQRRRKRGPTNNNKVLRHQLERHETKRLEAAVKAAEAADILQTDQAGLLEPENDMERTTSLTQTELKRNYLDDDTARHIYNLDMHQSAPYGLEYDRSGRYNIMYGAAGHLAMMDCHQQSLVTEFYVQERIRDACFLHNFTLFAAAQKNHAFIYDQTGAEVHRLSDHSDPMALQFLPYHWLLASVGRAGWLKYQDTSTGALVSQHRTQLGACRVLRQNPTNAILHAGHSNGTVTLWSPAQGKYLAKLLCHKGAAVHSLAVDPTGQVMVTGGADRRIRIWDLRMYKETISYFVRGGVPTSIDISQRGLLAVGHAGQTTIWNADALHRKTQDPYMHHSMPRCGPVETVRFRPFEDVLGIGHSRGVSSIVVPGAGEPSVDTSEYNTNPHQDAKQRKEAEVRALLDKLQPEMIALDPDQVGGIEESDPHKRLERLQDLQEEANHNKKAPKKEKSKKRGRSKIQTKLRRKHKNVVDQNTLKLREAREKEKVAKATEIRGEIASEAPREQAPSALKRFF